MNKRETRSWKIFKAVSLALLTTVVAVFPIFIAPPPPVIQASLSSSSTIAASNVISPDQLTSGHFNDTTPALSPNGGTIAFSSNRLSGATNQIWTMSALDGSHLTRLTNLNGNASDPKWNAESSMIAFAEKSGNLSSLWVINKNGTGLKMLRGDISGSTSFSWTHKGSNIAYNDIVKNISILEVMNIQNWESVIQFRCGQDRSCYEPSFNPNDTSLVYVERSQESYSLILGNVRNGNTSSIFRVLSNTTAQVSFPLFSIDGKSIYFLQKSVTNNSNLAIGSEGWGIYLLNIQDVQNNTARNILTPPPSMVYGLTWQPIISSNSLFSPKPDNSSEILVSGYSQKGIADIFLVDEDSSVEQFGAGGFALTAPAITVDRLTSLQYSSISGLMWSSDGNMIIFSAMSIGTSESHIFTLRYVPVVLVNPYTG